MQHLPRILGCLRFIRMDTRTFKYLKTVFKYSCCALLR